MTNKVKKSRYTSPKYAEIQRQYAKRANAWNTFKNKEKKWRKLYDGQNILHEALVWRFIEIEFKRYKKSLSSDSFVVKYIETSEMYKEIRKLWEERFGEGSYEKLMNDE